MKDELEGQEQDKEVTLETAEQKVEQSKEALEAAIEEKALELKRKGLAFLEELFNHFAMKIQIGQAALGRWMELVVPTF